MSKSIELFADDKHKYRLANIGKSAINEEIKIFIGSCTEEDAKVVEETYLEDIDYVPFNYNIFKKNNLIAIGHIEDFTEVGLGNIIKQVELKADKKVVKAYPCLSYPNVLHYTVLSLIKCAVEKLGNPKYIVLFKD